MDYCSHPAYAACRLCPRRCGINRTAGQKGRCGESAVLRLASASIHRGEEPPISGGGGSGTVFVAGCGLGCVFCQNWQISRGGMGFSPGGGELVRVFLDLEDAGAENINIVTGTHAAPALASAIRAAKEKGLAVPVLWNSSAYETPEALSLLDGLIDVWLPDLKTLDPSLAERYFNAPDYPEAAQKAVKRMTEVSELRYGPNGLLASGVIVRHLALPGHLEASREVFRWFAENARERALFSLMTQYTPVVNSGQGQNTGQNALQNAPERHLSPEEYEILLGWLEEFEIDDGFYQELVPDSAWLPDFSRPNPFSSALSKPIWHWSSGARKVSPLP